MDTNLIDTTEGYIDELDQSSPEIKALVAFWKSNLEDWYAHDSLHKEPEPDMSESDIKHFENKAWWNRQRARVMFHLVMYLHQDYSFDVAESMTYQWIEDEYEDLLSLNDRRLDRGTVTTKQHMTWRLDVRRDMGTWMGTMIVLRRRIAREKQIGS